MKNLDQITSKASLVVKQASILLKDPISNVENNSNPSTNIDHKISEYLTQSLKEVIDLDVLSEEDSSVFSKSDKDFWLIDPIDGTMNFISNSPDVAISVALVDKTFEAIISVVYLPFYDELYTAIRNKGAFLNGVRLHSSPPQLDIAAYGLPGDASKSFEKIGKTIGQLVYKNYVLRQSGSAVVDICRVAKGVWSVFFEEGLYVWDIAAANLIALESNCQSHVEISEKTLRCNYVVSNNKDILIDIKTTLRKY